MCARTRVSLLGHGLLVDEHAVVPDQISQRQRQRPVGVHRLALRPGQVPERGGRVAEEGTKGCKARTAQTVL